MIPLHNGITSPILYDTNLKCKNFASFQRIILIYILYRSWIIETGKCILSMHIDDFIAIYDSLEMALSSVIDNKLEENLRHNLQ